MIGGYEYMTIKDIAKLAGVSVATVSRVINDDPGVAEKLKNKVIQVVKETNYVPNTVGRNLRMSKSNMILVMLPTLSNPFYSKILKGIEQRASENGYGILVSVTHHDVKIEKKYLRMLQMKQADGVISLFSTLNIEELNQAAAKYPFVQCCEYTEGAKLPYVMINNTNAAYEATRYFISHGHKRIGVISGSFYESSETAREKGYRSALVSAGLDFDEKYIIKSNYKPEDGMEICHKLLSFSEPPTAILALSDTLAIGAIRYLKSVGMKVGEEIEVIGFDNSSIARVYDPALSTVAQPRFDLGTVSVDLVIEKINDLSIVNKGIILPHELILRESTCKRE
ncbi:MAG: transcriptional regulator, LacI family [Clostridia bacterium]|jgi:DNA-binding LacI/PurR family transcriptional regulator|nr:transcriptional regulator, LacI family [Clostridia bacterium]